MSESSEVEDADEQMSTSSEQTTDGKQQVRKAAAALAVGVGSFADPRDRQERLQTVSYYRKESRRGSHDLHCTTHQSHTRTSFTRTYTRVAAVYGGRASSEESDVSVQ